MCAAALLDQHPGEMSETTAISRLSWGIPTEAAAAAWPTCPTATAAAEPPEDPPAVLVVSQGLTVVPHSLLKVWEPAPNSGVLVLPAAQQHIAQGDIGVLTVHWLCAQKHSIHCSAAAYEQALATLRCDALASSTATQRDVQ